MHPLIVRHLLLPLHERLIGRDTLRRLSSLSQSQWWPVDRLQELQTQRLRRLLVHVDAHSPFFRARLAAVGVNPQRADLAELAMLPTLTKEDIYQHHDALVDRSGGGRSVSMSTGGSTGAPLSFQVNRGRQAADQASRMRARWWFGIEPGMRELYLWGSPIESQSGRRFRDYCLNHRMLAAFDMTPRSMARYVSEMTRFNPHHLFGYPSSLARLARFILDSGIKPVTPALRAVFTTGEVLLPVDRSILEGCFGVPVVDEYGARDAGFIAQQCPAGAYHVSMESLIVELLDERGQPVPTGERGEVTITHFDSQAMPFIRYRTGDFARWGGPCSCGRGLQTLTAIDGRKTDQLRTTRGGHAHGLSAIYPLRSVNEIAEFRVVQRAGLDLDVYIVERRPMSKAIEAAIRAELTTRIGPVDVRINRVERLAPLPSGKHCCVVCEAK